MADLSGRDLLALARLMIREAKLLKADGLKAEAVVLARRAIALDREGWRRRAQGAAAVCVAC